MPDGPRRKIPESDRPAGSVERALCDRLLFRSQHVSLGAFRCPTEHPCFATEGRITHFVLAFPRTAVWIEHEGAAPFVADPGVATLYNHGQPYVRRPISVAGDRSDWIGLSEVLAREIVGHVNARDAERPAPFSFRYLRVRSQHYVEQCRLFATAVAGGEPADIEERAIALAGRVLRVGYESTGGHDRAARRVARRQLAHDAKALIMATLSENHSASHLANELGVSVFHLCHTFRAITGLSMQEFRIAMRLRTSLHQAPAYRGRLSRLAVDLGFHSHSHFTFAFRKEFGLSPSAFVGEGARGGRGALGVRPVA